MATADQRPGNTDRNPDASRTRPSTAGKPASPDGSRVASGGEPLGKIHETAVPHVPGSRVAGADRLVVNPPGSLPAREQTAGSRPDPNGGIRDRVTPPVIPAEPLRAGSKLQEREPKDL